MSKAGWGTATAIGLIGAMVASQAHAQSAGGNDAEIAALKQQLRLMEQKLDKLQRQTTANTTAAANANAKADAKVNVASANAAYPVKGPVVPSGVVVTMPNNRPTICTADEQNCVAITSRIHWDVGGYDYRPNTAGTVPQKLDSGENLRRARIGMIGKFFGDWNYALIYDFGGIVGRFRRRGGHRSASCRAAATSGVENAYLSYTGFKPFGGKMAIEGGIMDLPWTLDEATSSNDILFMERASVGVIAQNIAAGDFRSTVGSRWWNDQFWIGAYVTGPTTGAIHSASSAAPPGTIGAIWRSRPRRRQSDQRQWLLGASRRRCGMADPAAAQSGDAGADARRSATGPSCASIRPTLISTGAIANVSGAQVYGVEAAATYGPLIAQGEYYWFNIDRTANTGLPPFGAPSLKFDGGYAQVGYVLTGETRAYNPATASYGGIKPANPFSLAGGGWGAWEIAGRVSTMNLNDQLATAAGIAGGRQTVYTAALNWYVNGNVRFMLDYLHGNVSKQATPVSAADAGSKFDAIAMRTQVAF